MPLNIEFSNGIESSGKQTKNPIFIHEKENCSVAEFSILHQKFLVFPFIPGNTHANSHFINNKYKVVGELRINKKRYLVTNSDDNSNCGKNTNNLVELLTRRELQIVMLVAEGKVNKQIAHQLNISEWTVSTHLRRIFSKLGVDSRASMVYQCSEVISNYSKQFNWRKKEM
ncbi:MAG: response regulator transcription factor [Candidatus Kuenenia sp.]|nr:response regulator transcription factor [Candidatus Kuenenia hertensis]